MASKLTGIHEIVTACGTMRRVANESRCDCGCGGTWDKTVSGTIGSEKAIWIGCKRRNGQSVGGGLTGDQCYAAHGVIAACEKVGIMVDDAVQSESKWNYGMRFIEGPLALDYERELLASVVATWGTTELGRRNPNEYLAGRRLVQRDIDIDDVCEGIWDRKATAGVVS